MLVTQHQQGEQMLPGCGFLACTQSSGEGKYLLQK